MLIIYEAVVAVNNIKPLQCGNILIIPSIVV